MSQEPEKPATKRDLNNAVSELRTEFDTKLGLQTESLRNEMQTMRVEMTEELVGRMNAMTQEIISQFNVVAENIRHDIGKANEEEISLLDDRVTRVEQHVGLRKA